MHKLLEQFEAAQAPAGDEGVVAIEYVVVAGAVVAALAALFAFGLGTILTDALKDIIDTIPGVTL
jgi:hypothetical protein